MGATPATDAERLDALRRRLYAPDVTEADIAAYRAAAPVQPVETVAARSALSTNPRSRRRSAGAAGAGAVLIAAGVAVLVITHPLAALTDVSPTRAPTPSVSAAPQMIDGELTASASARAGFVRALERGDHAGLLDYLYSHSAYIPPAISTPRRAASTEYSGQGSSTIALDPSALTEHGGRVTVFLVLDRDSAYSWHAQRVVDGDTRSGVLEVAEQTGSNRAGEATTVTFPYRDRAPTRLAVYTDDAVKWGAVVVFTD